MNKILRFLIGATLALNVTVAIADDVDIDDDEIVIATDVADDAVTDVDPDDESDIPEPAAPSVGQRMDCKTMKAKITELTSSGDNAGQLESLQKKYRNECVMRSSATRAGTARASRRGNVTASAGTSMKTSSMMSMATSKPIAKINASDNGAGKTEKTVTETKVDNAQITDEQKQMCDQLFDKMATFDADTKVAMKETYDTYCAASAVAAPVSVIKMTMVALSGTSTAGGATTSDGATTAADDAANAGPTEEELIAQMVANLEAGLCADGDKPNKYGCCAGETFKDMGNLQFGCCVDGTKECFPPLF